MSKEFTLGRAPENEIVLAFPFLSSQHAIITVSENEKLSFHIKDLNSTNGTFKNGKRVNEADFELSDSILLGSYELQASDFLPLFYANQSSRKTTTFRPSKTKSSVVIGGLLATIGVLSYFFIQQLPQFDHKLFNEKNAIFALGLWTLFFLIFRLLQSIRRSRRIKVAENTYIKFAIKRWEKQAEYALTSRDKKEKTSSAWSGFRKFELQRRDIECKDIVSFYLRPHDGLPLPSFNPGQYLTFKLNIAGKNKPVIKCYSLSDSPNQNYYRVSIKQVYAPPDTTHPNGVGSSFFHQQFNVGDIVDVKAPGGKFFMDFSRQKPVILLAGGIGITPMISMLNTLIDKQLQREVWFFYGTRNGEEHAMKDHFLSTAASHYNVKLRVLYSKPRAEDKIGIDYFDTGRLNVEYLKKVLPSNNYDFYLCGPPLMMSDLDQDLEDWGVPEQDIYSETFGPSKIKPKKVDNLDSSTDKETITSTITFARSNKTFQWPSANNETNLLDLGLNQDINLEYGCKSGNCGNCVVALRSGKVKYTSDNDFAPDQGSCLLCVTVPDGDIVLDA